MHTIEESPDEKAARRFVGFVVWLLALIAFGAIVAAVEGCATPAPCKEAEAFIARAEGLGMFYGFTPEALAQWTDTIRKEARGECAFPKSQRGSDT